MISISCFCKVKSTSIRDCCELCPVDFLMSLCLSIDFCICQAGWVQLLSNDHIPELIQTWIHSVVHCWYVWLHRFFRSKARLQNPELGILFSDQVLWCVGGWTVRMCMDVYECDAWMCMVPLLKIWDLCKNVLLIFHFSFNENVCFGALDIAPRLRSSESFCSLSIPKATCAKCHVKVRAHFFVQKMLKIS